MPVRAHDISLLPWEPNYIGSAAKPVHTGPWDFLAEVPLVFYGPGVVEPAGDVEGAVTLADVAPSIGAALGYNYRTRDGDDIISPYLTGTQPLVVLTVVWDGGGWNALEEHEGRWPFLKRLMARGVSFTDAEIGSTPSNTPPIHTTLGTGVFPRRHGIPAVKMTLADGSYVDPYEGHDADFVEVPTLADRYDLARGNRPVIGLVATVNWHLGMIGHGAARAGGDRDIALLMNDQGDAYGNTDHYEVPASSGASLVSEAGALDAQDGERDGLWDDRDLTDPAVRYASPAYVSFQGRVLEDIVAAHGFGRDRVADLLFTNFKSIDDAGHRWGMTSAETGEVIAATDDTLRSVLRSLDAQVGEGKWMVVLTADHGQTPYPEESGGWPIGGGELKDDVNRALDRNGDGKDLVTRVTSAGAFIDESQLEPNEVTLTEVAEWMVGYTAGENLKEGQRSPRSWADRLDETLFQAVVIRDGKAIVSCSRA